eukprot:460586-Prorocentrum_minimum.AAC.1
MPLVFFTFSPGYEAHGRLHLTDTSPPQPLGAPFDPLWTPPSDPPFGPPLRTPPSDPLWTSPRG